MDEQLAETPPAAPLTLRTHLIFMAKAAASFVFVFGLGVAILGLDVTGGIEQRAHANGLRSPSLMASVDGPMSMATPTRWAQTPAPQQISEVAWRAEDDAFLSGDQGDSAELLGGAIDGVIADSALAPEASAPMLYAEAAALPILGDSSVRSLEAPIFVAQQIVSVKKPKS